MVGAMSMRLLLTALVVAVASVALAAAGPAGARAPAKTTVTIKGQNGAFSGKVFSPRKSCRGNRKVIVHRLRGNGFDPANDPRVGSDTSKRVGNHGEWSLGNTGIKNGRFYARVARSPGCRGAFSLPIKL
jgi:hypothetical protein